MSNSVAQVVLVGKKTITIDEEQYNELVAMSKKRSEQLTRMREYNKAHDREHNEKKECPECGALIIWRGYKKHCKTTKHLTYVGQSPTSPTTLDTAVETMQDLAALKVI